MKKVFIFVLLFTPFTLFAQNSISVEAQAYPAGIIPSVRFDYDFGNNSLLTSRIGYNFTDRKDYGENDNEEGGGLGFSLGYAKTNFLTKNLAAHLRTDLWFMEIDWNDTETICGTVPPCFESDITGTTDITVFQPTLGLEYNIPFTSSLFVKPSISFGYEINIKTKGRKVGEGAILLGGLNVGFEF